MVTDNDVVVEIPARRMAVHGNARKAIVCKPIINNHVAVGLCTGPLLSKIGFRRKWLVSDFSRNQRLFRTVSLLALFISAW